VKLKVLKRYKTVAFDYAAGATITVGNEFGLWLLADAPGCFQEIVPDGPHFEAFVEPAQDRKMRGRPKKRG